MADNREDSLEQRMHRLEAELASKQADMKAESGPSKESLQGYRLAVKLSSEFVSAILVGVFLGWGLDWLAGTWPWGMVIFLMLGFAAGVMNVLRSSGVVKTPHPVDKLGDMNRKKKTEG